MYLDSQLLFTGTPAAPGQAITATAISTNVIDTQATTIGGAGVPINTLQSLGVGVGDLYLVLRSGAAFGGTGNITISLETDSAANLASSTVLVQSPTFVASSIGANTDLMSIQLPGGLQLYKRYLGLRFTCTGTPTGGTIWGFLSTSRQANSLFVAPAFVVA